MNGRESGLKHLYPSLGGVQNNPKITRYNFKESTSSNSNDLELPRIDTTTQVSKHQCCNALKKSSSLSPSMRVNKVYLAYAPHNLCKGFLCDSSRTYHLAYLAKLEGQGGMPNLLVT